MEESYLESEECMLRMKYFITFFIVVSVQIGFIAIFIWMNHYLTLLLNKLKFRLVIQVVLRIYAILVRHVLC